MANSNPQNSSVIEFVKGRGIPLPENDVDTDRIIPARYLKFITFEGLGAYAFYDERFDEQDRPKPHPFNDPKYREPLSPGRSQLRVWLVTGTRPPSSVSGRHSSHCSPLLCRDLCRELHSYWHAT